MGARYQLDCKKYNYKTESSCGLDSGMVATVETHICLDCREIIDVLVGQYSEKI